MNKNDINRLFTEQVTALLAKGYQIQTSTMSGSQGEIAHIDLSNGKEILRVLLDRECCFGDSYGDYITIKVGKSTDSLHGRWDDTVWNNHLEIRFQIKLAQITDNYFVTPEEATPMAQKRYDRYVRNGRRYDFTVSTRELGNAYKSIALRWLRRQPKMKTCKLEDIGKMVKAIHRDGTSSYEITAKGKTYRLSARKR